MNCRAGLVWATPQHFNRFIEDCGIFCELVTPHMLAAPFFRGNFNCLIIPTGFANPAYSNLLPALRASSPRMKRFVESGGGLLVFGASVNRSDSYDWLPFDVKYSHNCGPRAVECLTDSDTSSIIDDYDTQGIECDGYFPSHDGDCIGIAGTASVLIEKKIGLGRIVVTSIHEFPSRTFLKKFCCSGVSPIF